MSYFIIKDHDPRTVWHYIRREWCVDIDAKYGLGFEYADYASVAHRADVLRQSGVHVDIVTRHRLFELLEVRDWAGPSR